MKFLEKKSIVRKVLSAFLVMVLALTCFAAVPSPSVHAAAMTIDSTEGAITQNEINSYKAFIATLPLPVNNWDPAINDFCYKNTGHAVESMGILYEKTRDISILNSMINFADRMLAARNDPGTGRILWTGNRELCWPNRAPGDAMEKYSGSENGDVIAHIAYCAKLILQNSSLWNTTVSIGDTFGYGTTYKARAQKYITELDKTMDTFITPNFVRSSDKKFYWPNSTAFADAGGNAGNAIPWNQQMMLNGGYQRLAECHEILGDNPSKVAEYDNIVRTSVSWFTSELVSYQKNGYDVYKWSYTPGDATLRYIENSDDAHGAYDVLGMYRAFKRGTYGVAHSTMAKFANTVKQVISTGAGTFYTSVDGTGTTTSRLYSEWMYLTPFDTSIYPILCNSSELAYAAGKSDHFAMIMWVKDMRSTNYALNKSAAASSTWSSSYSAAKAVDGSDSTRWSAASGQTSNQWLAIDMGESTTVNKVVIKEISFPRVTSYKLQYSSDGSTYTDISGTTGTTIGSNKSITFSPKTARYIRLYITSASGVPTIDEMQVFNY